MSKKEGDISFVARSKRRTQVLKLLVKGSKAQSELRKLTKMYKSHISRTIDELSSKGFIRCLNPKDRAYRFFEITPKGKSIIKRVELIINS